MTPVAACAAGRLQDRQVSDLYGKVPSRRFIMTGVEHFKKLFYFYYICP